jgi:hypothetical protein
MVLTSDDYNTYQVSDTVRLEVSSSNLRRTTSKPLEFRPSDNRWKDFHEIWYWGVLFKFIDIIKFLLKLKKLNSVALVRKRNIPT